jgi:hypothetical protein
MHWVVTPVYGRKSVVEKSTIRQTITETSPKLARGTCTSNPSHEKMSGTQLLFDSGIDIVAAFRKNDHNQGRVTL